VTWGEKMTMMVDVSIINLQINDISDTLIAQLYLLIDRRRTAAR